MAKLPKIDVNFALYNRDKQDIQSWLAAWLSAENHYYPRRIRLVDLYEMLLVDGHLTAIIGNRKNKVLGEPYLLRDANDNQNPTLLPLLQKSWLRDFINFSLDSIFFGHSLIEITELTDANEIGKITLIERRNVVPEQSLVLYNSHDTTGSDYTAPFYKNHYVSIQDRERLGLLLKAAPDVIYKRFSRASWSVFLERFGMPIITVQTDKTDAEKREVSDALVEMGREGSGVFGKEDEVKTHFPAGGDSSKNFKEKVLICNSELSKLILGQTMTTDDGSSKSQAVVHENVSEEIQEADMELIQNIINGELMPRLVAIGYPTELLNWKFEYKLFYDRRQEEKLKQAAQAEEVKTKKFERLAQLLPYYDADPAYIKQEFDIEVLPKSTPPISAPANGEKKK